MKKVFYALVMVILIMISGTRSFGQLDDGSLAPNFSLIDITGSTHVLYNYLDAGKPVIIDFSAVWCGPCWSYHQSGALETAFNSWGPSGTNELRVLWIEGDENPLACLQGTGCNTQGDWTAGTPYPMILTVAPNGNSVVSNYSIGYWPTVYVICPDRVLIEAGQVNANTLRTKCSDCPPLPTTTNDAKVFSIIDPITSSCLPNITPKVRIQNYGSANLTSLTLTSKVDGVVVGTPYVWTGSKARFETVDITLPVMSGVADGAHTYTVEVSLPNGVADENAANNSMNSSFAVFSAGANVLVKVITDNYPSEISWKIFEQGTSNIVAQKDKLVQGTNNTYVCLDFACYTYTIYDTYGDGILSPGRVTISYNGTTYVDFMGTTYTTTKSVDFCVTAIGLGEEYAISSLSVYPNPFVNSTNLSVNLSEPQEVALKVYNMLGEVVYEVNEDLGAGDHIFELNGENLSDGIYIVRMNIGDQTISKKIELTR